MGESETKSVRSDRRGNLLAIGAVALVVLLVVASTAVVTTNGPEGGSAPEANAATDLVESGVENELEREADTTGNTSTNGSAPVNVTASIDADTFGSPVARRAVDRAFGDRISASTRQEVAGLLTSIAQQQRRTGAITSIEPTNASVEFGVRVQLGHGGNHTAATAGSDVTRTVVVRTVERQPRSYTRTGTDRPGPDWERTGRTGTETIVLESEIATEAPGEEWEHVRVLGQQNATYDTVTNATRPSPDWERIGENGTTTDVTDTVVETEAPGENWTRLKSYGERDEITRTQVDTTKPGPEWERVETVDNVSVVANSTVATESPGPGWVRESFVNTTEPVYEHSRNTTAPGPRWNRTGITNRTATTVVSRTTAENSPGPKWKELHVVDRSRAVYDYETGITDPGPDWQRLKQVGNRAVTVGTETKTAVRSPGPDWDRASETGRTEVYVDDPGLDTASERTVTRTREDTVHTYERFVDDPTAHGNVTQYVFEVPENYTETQTINESHWVERQTKQRVESLVDSDDTRNWEQRTRTVNRTKTYFTFDVPEEYTETETAKKTRWLNRQIDQPNHSLVNRDDTRNWEQNIRNVTVNTTYYTFERGSNYTDWVTNTTWVENETADESTAYYYQDKSDTRNFHREAREEVYYSYEEKKTNQKTTEGEWVRKQSPYFDDARISISKYDTRNERLETYGQTTYYSWEQFEPGKTVTEASWVTKRSDTRPKNIPDVRNIQRDVESKNVIVWEERQINRRPVTKTEWESARSKSKPFGDRIRDVQQHTETEIQQETYYTYDIRDTYQTTEQVEKTRWISQRAETKPTHDDARSIQQHTRTVSDEEPYYTYEQQETFRTTRQVESSRWVEQTASTLPESRTRNVRGWVERTANSSPAGSNVRNVERRTRTVEYQDTEWLVPVIEWTKPITEDESVYKWRKLVQPAHTVSRYQLIEQKPVYEYRKPVEPSQTYSEYVTRDTVSRDRWKRVLNEGGTLVKYGQTETVPAYEWRRKVASAKTVSEYQRTEERPVYQWGKTTTDVVTGLKQIEIEAKEIARTDAPQKLLANATGTRDSTITFVTDSLPVGPANATIVTAVPHGTKPLTVNPNTAWTLRAYRATNGTGIIDVEGVSTANDGPTTRVNLDEMAVNGTPIDPPTPAKAADIPMDIYLLNGDGVLGAYSLFATNQADSEMGSAANVTVTRAIDSATFDVTYQDDRTTYTDRMVVEPDHDPFGSVVVNDSDDGGSDPDAPDADFTITEQSRNDTHVTYRVDASRTTADALITTYEWTATDYVSRVATLRDGQMSQTFTAERGSDDYYVPIELRVVDEGGREDTIEKGTIVPGSGTTLSAGVDLTITALKGSHATVLAEPVNLTDPGTYDHDWTVQQGSSYVDDIGIAPTGEDVTYTVARQDDGDVSLAAQLTVTERATGDTDSAVGSLTIPEKTNQPPEAGIYFEYERTQNTGGKFDQEVYRVHADEIPTFHPGMADRVLSTDPDGTVVGYNYTFPTRQRGVSGAQIIGRGEDNQWVDIAVQRQSDPYTVDVDLTVTDDDGATDTTTGSTRIRSGETGLGNTLEITLSRINRSSDAVRYQVAADSSLGTFDWSASEEMRVTNLTDGPSKQTFTADRRDTSWDLTITGTQKTRAGEKTDSATVTVPGTLDNGQDNLPPSAVLDATRVESTYENVTYELSSVRSSDDGTIESRSWEKTDPDGAVSGFESGGQEMTVVVERPSQEAEPRTIPVTLIVTDDVNASDTDSTTLRINADAGGGSDPPDGGEPDPAINASLDASLDSGFSTDSPIDIELDASDSSASGGDIVAHEYTTSVRKGQLESQPADNRSTQTIQAITEDGSIDVTFTLEVTHSSGGVASDTDTVMMPNPSGGYRTKADLNATLVDHRGGAAAFELDATNSQGVIEQWDYEVLEGQSAGSVESLEDGTQLQTVVVDLSDEDPDAVVQLTVEDQNSNTDTANATLSAELPPIDAALDAKMVDEAGSSMKIRLDANESKPNAHIADWQYGVELENGTLDSGFSDGRVIQERWVGAENGSIDATFTLTIQDESGRTDTATASISKRLGDGNLPPEAALESIKGVREANDTITFEIDASDSADPDSDIKSINYDIIEEKGEVLDTIQDGKETQQIDVGVVENKTDAVIEVNVSDGELHDTARTELDGKPEEGKSAVTPEIQDVVVTPAKPTVSQQATIAVQTKAPSEVAVSLNGTHIGTIQTADASTAGGSTEVPWTSGYVGKVTHTITSASAIDWSVISYKRMAGADPSDRLYNTRNVKLEATNTAGSDTYTTTFDQNRPPEARSHSEVGFHTETISGKERHVATVSFRVDDRNHDEIDITSPDTTLCARIINENCKDLSDKPQGFDKQSLIIPLNSAGDKHPTTKQITYTVRDEHGGTDTETMVVGSTYFRGKLNAILDPRSGSPVPDQVLNITPSESVKLDYGLGASLDSSEDSEFLETLKVTHAEMEVHGPDGNLLFQTQDYYTRRSLEIRFNYAKPDDGMVSKPGTYTVTGEFAIGNGGFSVSDSTRMSFEINHIEGTDDGNKSASSPGDTVWKTSYPKPTGAWDPTGRTDQRVIDTETTYSPDPVKDASEDWTLVSRERSTTEEYPAQAPDSWQKGERVVVESWTTDWMDAQTASPPDELGIDIVDTEEQFGQVRYEVEKVKYEYTTDGTEYTWEKTGLVSEYELDDLSRYLGFTN